MELNSSNAKIFEEKVQLLSEEIQRINSEREVIRNDMITAE